MINFSQDLQLEMLKNQFALINFDLDKYRNKLTGSTVRTLEHRLTEIKGEVAEIYIQSGKPVPDWCKDD